MTAIALPFFLPVPGAIDESGSADGCEEVAIPSAAHKKPPPPRYMQISSDVIEQLAAGVAVDVPSLTPDEHRSLAAEGLVAVPIESKGPGIPPHIVMSLRDVKRWAMSRQPAPNPSRRKPIKKAPKASVSPPSRAAPPPTTSLPALATSSPSLELPVIAPDLQVAESFPAANTKPASEQPVPAPDLHSVQVIIQRAMKGDQSVLPALREWLEKNCRAWQYYGNLGRQVEESWLGLIAGKNELLRESLSRYAEAMKFSLAGTDASPLEQLLVLRVVACWLQVEYADAMFAQHQSGNVRTLEFLSKLQERSQRRFLEATRSLATVRRLLPNDLPAPVAVTTHAPKPLEANSGKGGNEVNGHNPRRQRKTRKNHARRAALNGTRPNGRHVNGDGKCRQNGSRNGHAKPGFANRFSEGARSVKTATTAVGSP